MFLFKDVIDQLETAEASLINLVDKTGSIPPENYNKVLGFLNTAMSDLFTRFTMVKGQCIVQTTEGKHSYLISKENAITQNPLGFIIDDAEFPFDDTVLEITSVSTMHNRQLKFNVMDQMDYSLKYSLEKSYSVDECTRSFNSPSYGVLRTPVGLRDSRLKVDYKVGHTAIPSIPVVDLPTFNPESIVIDLPYPFLMPIVFYICSRVYNRRGSERAGNSIRDEGSSYFSKYLAEVRTLKESMSQATETTAPVDTFAMKGFI